MTSVHQTCQVALVLLHACYVLKLQHLKEQVLMVNLCKAEVSNVQVVSAWPALCASQGGACCEEGAGLCATGDVGQVWHPDSPQGKASHASVMHACIHTYILPHNCGKLLDFPSAHLTMSMALGAGSIVQGPTVLSLSFTTSRCRDHVVAVSCSRTHLAQT